MDNTPSHSLINAAFTSLAGGVPAVGAAAAVAAVGAAAAVAAVVGGVAGVLMCGPLGFGLLAVDIVKTYHSVLVPSVAAAGQSVPRQYLQGPVEVDMNCVASEFHHDFTNIWDVGKTFVRGSQPYERPCGSYRIALKVKDKFGKDNVWLGMTGNELGEWPVSYHGTAKNHAQDIAEEGYKLSKGKRFKYGKGIYSTPELAVAKQYASKFRHEGTSYSCILQNRVNPKYLKVIPKEETHVGTYWLSAADNDGVDESELLRPYGICLFKEH